MDYYGSRCPSTAIPPLYYYYIKVLTALFDYSEFAVRICSIVPYVILLVVAFVTIPTFLDRKTSMIFGIVFVFFPFSIVYSVEARMYSLAALFVFVSAIFGLKCIRCGKKRDWVVLTVSTICAAYTHYFALVAVGIVYAILLIYCIAAKQDYIKKWLLSSIVVFGCYIPWLGCFITQLKVKVTSEYWIGPITFRTLFEYIKCVFGSNNINYLYVFVILCFFLVFLSIIMGKDRNTYFIVAFLLSVPVFTLVVGLVASFVIRPVFIIRYLVPCAPLLILFLAFGLSRMLNKNMACIIMTVLLLGGIDNYFNLLRNEPIKYIETQIRNNMLEENVNCYIIDSTHYRQLAGIIACYKPYSLVYAEESMKQENMPLRNIEKWDQGCLKSIDRALLITDVGEKPEDYYSDYFNIDEWGEVVFEGEGTTMVYMLTAK